MHLLRSFMDPDNQKLTELVRVSRRDRTKAISPEVPTAFGRTFNWKNVKRSACTSSLEHIHNTVQLFLFLFILFFTLVKSTCIHTELVYTRVHLQVKRWLFPQQNQSPGESRKRIKLGCQLETLSSSQCRFRTMTAS